MLASVIFTGASQLLSDAGNDRWTAANLLTYLNQARRRIIEMKPAEFSELRAVQLSAGVRQTLPSDCAVLLGVTRNMGADGATPGAAIHRVDRTSLDAFTPSWMSSTDTTIKEYVYTSGADHYLVNPGIPATPDVYAEIELAAYLADLTDSAGSEATGLPDKYEMAQVYWLCHQAFAEDTEASSAELSITYYKAFVAEMGNDQSQ